MSTIKVFQSKRDDSYVVYDTINFTKHHTHTNNKATAEIIRKNVIKRIVPKSNDPYFIISHIRLSTDKDYILKLKEKINTIDSHAMTPRVNKKIKTELLSKVEALLQDPSSLLRISDKEASGLVGKLKTLIKKLPTDVDVNYLFNKSCFIISHKDLVLEREYIIEIYQNFSCRLLLILNHTGEDVCTYNKKYNNINTDGLLTKIKTFMKVGDIDYGKPN